MPITYIRINDRPVKALSAIILVILLILVIFGVGILLGVLPSTWKNRFVRYLSGSLPRSTWWGGTNPIALASLLTEFGYRVE